MLFRSPLLVPPALPPPPSDPPPADLSIRGRLPPARQAQGSYSVWNNNRSTELLATRLHILKALPVILPVAKNSGYKE